MLVLCPFPFRVYFKCDFIFKLGKKLTEKRRCLICPEYAIFAVKVKLRVTTSATPTVKREELSK
jgi:hypothetical protein